MHKILCVEDGEDTRLILDQTLRGHHLVFADSVREAERVLHSDSFSLILMDVELPDGSGLELLSLLSETIGSTPVMFLTMKSDFLTKASAFALGAEDFIVKPFDPREVRLRVNAKLNRIQRDNGNANELRVGPLICSLSEQRVYSQMGHHQIELTAIEFKIFSTFAHASKKVFSRAELLDRVWGNGVSVNDRAVDVHISNLRKKLINSGVSIDAVINSGYRLLIK